MENQNLLGAAWLVAHYGVAVVVPLSEKSLVGGRRSSQIIGGLVVETYVEGMRPTADLRGHLTFHLKHEVLHLELLARVFGQMNPNELSDWISAEPSGQYARRAGFLYEWLTGKELSINANITGSYVIPYC
jgi:hypothetical protein